MAAGIPTIRQIQEATAREFEVPASWMVEPYGTGRTQMRVVSHPRQAAMSLAVLLTEHSLVRIGHFFGGRDHSTVIHAHRAVTERRRADAKLHEKMRRLTLEVIGRGG